jgi:AraC-like DNA-binding protein
MARGCGRNVVRYWQDRHLGGLSLMHADFTTQEFAPHRHEGYVVAVTELGGSVIRSRGQVENADASVVFVFNPDEPHSGWMGASRHWRYRSLYLEQDSIAAVARGLGIERVPYFIRNCFADCDLIQGFAALHRALELDVEPLRERELLISIFGILFSRYGSGGDRAEAGSCDRARVNAACELIRAGLGQPLRLETLSSAIGVTQFQLIRLFRRTVGLTPHAYVIQARLDAARRCLTQGMAIGQAAAAAGFYDQSALTRYFKRSYAVTPAQYARAIRK